MSSEVPELSDEEINKICDLAAEKWRQAESGSPRQFKARAIEQAVRAQWAAEVAEWKGAYEARSAGVQELLKQLAEIAAERDSAQAEAKRLREALSLVRDSTAVLNHLDVDSLEVICAALQPGASSHDE